MSRGWALGVGLLVAAALGFCAWRWHLSQQEAERRAREAAALSSVLGSLRDPMSAQFSELRWSLTQGIICGKLNAKNNYGAYIGATRFLSEARRHALEGESLKGWAAKGADVNDAIKLLEIATDTIGAAINESEVKGVRLDKAAVELLVRSRQFEALWLTYCS